VDCIQLTQIRFSGCLLGVQYTGLSVSKIRGISHVVEKLTIYHVALCFIELIRMEVNKSTLQELKYLNFLQLMTDS
jgi:hypothetical protein